MTGPWIAVAASSMVAMVFGCIAWRFERYGVWDNRFFWSRAVARVAVFVAWACLVKAVTP